MRGRRGSPRSLLCHLSPAAPARHGMGTAGFAVVRHSACSVDLLSGHRIAKAARIWRTTGHGRTPGDFIVEGVQLALACVGVAGRPGHFDERASSTRRVESRRPPCAGAPRRCRMGPGRQAQDAEKPSLPAASTCFLSSNVLRCRQSSIPFPSRHQLRHTLTRAFRRDPCYGGRVRCRRRADPTMSKNVART